MITHPTASCDFCKQPIAAGTSYTTIEVPLMAPDRQLWRDQFFANHPHLRESSNGPIGVGRMIADQAIPKTYTYHVHTSCLFGLMPSMVAVQRACIQQTMQGYAEARRRREEQEREELAEAGAPAPVRLADDGWID